MKAIIIVMCGALFVCPLYAQSENVNSPPLDVNLSQCGINALYTSLKHLGTSVSLDDLYNNIERSSNNQVNLWQLAQFAREKGLYVRGIEHPSVSLLKKTLSDESCIILQFRVPRGEFSMLHILSLVKSSNGDTIVLDIPLLKRAVNDDNIRDLIEHSQGMIILSSKPFSAFSLATVAAFEKTWAFPILLSLAIMILTAILIRRQHRKSRS